MKGILTKLKKLGFLIIIMFSIFGAIRLFVKPEPLIIKELIENDTELTSINIPFTKYNLPIKKIKTQIKNFSTGYQVIGESKLNLAKVEIIETSRISNTKTGIGGISLGTADVMYITPVIIHYGIDLYGSDEIKIQLNEREITQNKDVTIKINDKTFTKNKDITTIIESITIVFPQLEITSIEELTDQAEDIMSLTGTRRPENSGKYLLDKAKRSIRPKVKEKYSRPEEISKVKEIAREKLKIIMLNLFKSFNPNAFEYEPFLKVIFEDELSIASKDNIENP